MRGQSETISLSGRKTSELKGAKGPHSTIRPATWATPSECQIDDLDEVLGVDDAFAPEGSRSANGSSATAALADFPE